MGTDAQRAKLYSTVADNWGEEAAETVMAALPPWDYTEVARQSDIKNLQVSFEARFDQIDARFSQMEARFSQVDARFDRLEANIQSKMDQQFARLLIWTIGIVVALASLILSAVAFV